MRKRWLLALVAIWAVAPAAQAAPLRAGEVRGNIVYGMYSGLALLLDVKASPTPNGYAVLHIPGSGWQAPLGWDDWELKDPAAQHATEQAFLDAGFAVVTINHRAAPRFGYPAPVEDAQRAARFVRAHLGGWGLHDDWLGLLGESSGGHLVSMLATLGEGTDTGLQPAPGNHRAQCVVAVMAPTDLLPLGQDGWGVALATQFVGTTAPFPEEAKFPGYAERLKPWVAASPITYVAGAAPLPSFLLLHGDKDKLVPIAQSQAFAAKLKAAGATVQFDVMTGAGHQFPLPYPTRAATWMRDCLARTQAAAR